MGVASLTGRELEIARLVVDRRTNPEIAAELFLSIKTVETHMRNIFRKLDANSRVEVARIIERDRAAESNTLNHGVRSQIRVPHPMSGGSRSITLAKHRTHEQPMTTDTAAFRDHTHEFPLADGRTLGYGLYGASDGPLVVVLDGPGSRGLARAMASPAAQLGIKLLAPDRPGFG